MSDEGVFCVHRGLFNHPLFAGEVYTRVQAWVWLVGNAAWKPTRVRVKDSVISLERGQCAYSLRFLGVQWKWSKNKVATFLDRLVTEQMIRTQAGRDATLITICNYDEYQFIPGRGRDTERDAGGTQEGRRRDKEEEVNKRKKEEVAADAAANGSSSPTSDAPPAEASMVGRERYAFEGDVIRLTARDFEKWSRAYPKLNLRAELTARDAWLATAADRDRERWFVSTAAHLRNQNAKAAKGAEFKWASGIEGVY